MKRLFRAVVAAVVCAFVLAPAASGRMRFSRMGHPIGDDNVLAASANQGTSFSVMVVELIPGFKFPVFLIVQAVPRGNDPTHQVQPKVPHAKGARQ